MCSCNEGGCGRRVVFERWRDLLLCLVVARETVDTRLNQDKAELGVFVLAVCLEVLSHSNRLFDKVPKVLRNLRSKTYGRRKNPYMRHNIVTEHTVGFQDTEDLVTSHKSHLGDTMRVPKSNTNLRGSKTLTGQLVDVLNDVLRGGLQPGRGGPAVRESRGRYTEL